MNFDHIVVVIEENRSFDSVIGNQNIPYMNYLARNGALFTNSYHIRHPSQCNYIALFSGNLHGIQNNGVYEKINAPNLYTALASQGKTFLCYSEDLPYVGYDGERSGQYVRKHNPSTQFTTVPPIINQPFSSFPTNFEELPDVCFVVPNLDNDAHDGTVEEADNWLYKNLAKYAQWCLNNNSLLIITFDEPERYPANPRIPTIFYGANITPGVYNDEINHYSLVKFILELNGIQTSSSVPKIPKTLINY